jgi:hypothetical protein
MVVVVLVVLVVAGGIETLDAVVGLRLELGIFPFYCCES